MRVQAREAALLCQWALHLLRSYATASRHGTALRSGALQAGADEDVERELRALVRLLSNSLQRDLLDFSEDGDSTPVPVGEVRMSCPCHWEACRR